MCFHFILPLYLCSISATIFLKCTQQICTLGIHLVSDVTDAPHISHLKKKKSLGQAKFNNFGG